MLIQISNPTNTVQETLCIATKQHTDKCKEDSFGYTNNAEIRDNFKGKQLKITTHTHTHPIAQS